MVIPDVWMIQQQVALNQKDQQGKKKGKPIFKRSAWIVNFAFKGDTMGF